MVSIALHRDLEILILSICLVTMYKYNLNSPPAVIFGCKILFTPLLFVFLSGRVLSLMRLLDAMP